MYVCGKLRMSECSVVLVHSNTEREEHCVCQVIDKSGQTTDFDDTSNVEKYEMSETDYAQRTGSSRAACWVSSWSCWVYTIL